MADARLSTDQFVSYLAACDVQSSGLLRVCSVDFNPDVFLELIPSTQFLVMESHDGPISVVQDLNDPIDYSHQSGPFDLHKDGLYYTEVPNLVLLYCQEPGAALGSTVFADTRQAIRLLRDSQHWGTLQQLELQYLGRDKSRFPHPLITSHPLSGDQIINLAARAFITPISNATTQSLPSFRETLQALTAMVDALEDAIVLTHTWHAGDLILFDNNTYVHGRISSVRDIRRKLLRIWLRVSEGTNKDSVMLSVKKPSSVTSTHSTSISSWANEINKKGGDVEHFASGILDEEKGKLERLRELATRIDLPIYDSSEFTLPEQFEHYRQKCSDIAETGDWNLALRFSRLPLKVAFFRQLDATFTDAIKAAHDYSNEPPFLASVTPYRVPERSGTLWIRDGYVVLEMVFGPHELITKASTDNLVQRCTYNFPDASVRYSTNDSQVRSILYESLRDVVKLVVGCTLRDIAEIRTSAYAEFHWHARFGYRFIECSFSPFWTGGTPK